MAPWKWDGQQLQASFIYLLQMLSSLVLLTLKFKPLLILKLEDYKQLSDQHQCLMN